MDTDPVPGAEPGTDLMETGEQTMKQWIESFIKPAAEQRPVCNYRDNYYGDQLCYSPAKP